jgi:S-adenosylmethionine:tRNA ribosyltransferase-isomerase
MLSKIPHRYDQVDLTQFQYQLPERLIAQFPPERRTDCRLLSLDGASGEIADLKFIDILDLLKPGDLLVLNDTRVVPARLYGHKQSGGRIELLIERIIDPMCARTQIRASKALKPGNIIYLQSGAEVIEAVVNERHGDFYLVRFSAPVTELMQRQGHVPLPPYIKRSSTSADSERYQTVYARRPGAVAAPTAGLHFDHALMKQLRTQGVDTAFLTLHVGAGSFQPLRVTDIRQHRMHAEWVEVPRAVCERVTRVRACGARVVAVGTTVVRALETAAASGELHPFAGDSRLFIYPGYRFRMIDAMITNFHLPGSTLLMLVCAFAGTTHTLAAYAHAIERQYRFYSYGDAMFLTPCTSELVDKVHEI